MARGDATKCNPKIRYINPEHNHVLKKDDNF